MLIILIAVLLGIWKYRSRYYFKWVVFAFLWMLAGNVLFYAGGTLQNPEGDGLITRQIRIATQDGPGMGIFAILFLVAYWGGMIFFVSRMVKAARIFTDQQNALYFEDGFGEKSDTTRKMLETGILLLVSAIWVFFAFYRPMFPTALVSTSVEEELATAANEVNQATPQQIDPITTLDNATVSGRRLTYHYTVKAKPSEKERLRAFAVESTIPKVCDGEMRKGMRDSDVSYAYSYMAVGFKSPVVIEVTEPICKKRDAASAP